MNSSAEPQARELRSSDTRGPRSLRHVAALLALLLTLGVAEHGWAKGASLAEATPEQKESASRYYQSAAQALQSSALQAALTGFQASYDVVASPNSHFMVVQVLEMLGRIADAYNELPAVIAEAEAAKPLGEEKYGKTAEAAKERLAALRPRVGLIQVDVSAEPEAKLTVGGYAVDSSRWGTPIAAMPGKVGVVLEGPSGRREQDVTVMAGELKKISLALAQTDVSEFDTDGPAGPGKPKPGAGGAGQPGPGGEGDEPGGSTSIFLPVGIAAGAVGVVGFVLTGIFGSMAQSEYDALAEECGEAGCAPERSGEADTGRTYQTVSNAMLIVGAVGLATGAALVIYSFTGGADAGDEAATASVSLGPGSVLLRGTF